jgi:hypothetical protein
MLSIPQARARIKANTPHFVDQPLVSSLCRDLALPFRRRLLTPLVTTQLFLRQVLEGNAAVAELRRVTKLDFSESAYCDARQRLPLAFFQRLHHAVLGRCRRDADDDPAARWRGHRVFFLDGSSFSMPDTPELREEFGCPGGQAEGCGFPTAHLLVQFHAHSGYLTRARPAPLRTHDLAQAALTHKELRPGDVVGGDRAFGSYAHLALLGERGCFGLFRAHQRRKIVFAPGPDAPPPTSRRLRRLGRHDQVVEYHKPKACPAWMDRRRFDALPATLAVRELRVKVKTPGRRVHTLTLVTTLLDPKAYPKEALARLYEKRWQVEVNLRPLKQTLGLDVLRCQTFKGVWQELMMFVTAYNLVRRVMVEAGRRQEVAPDRISFVDALRWLRAARRGEEVPRLKVTRERPGRVEPRVKKRRPKQFDLMTKPRAVLKAALLNKTKTKKEVAA